MNVNDHIYLRANEDVELSNLCGEIMLRSAVFNDEDKLRKRIATGCPSDIIVAKTVPLKSCVIHVKDTVVTCHVRFDYPSVSLIFENGEHVWSARTEAFDGMNLMTIDIKSIRLNGRPIPITQLNAHADRSAELWKAMGYGLRIWYALQIMLLNPYVKDVFRTVDKKETHFNPNGKKRKYKVCYVRHHYLNPDAHIGLGTTANGGKLRHTMAWYVCGHWRHYQDGKTVFVQPCWKGPLRETKVCEPRERVVV